MLIVSCYCSIWSKPTFIFSHWNYCDILDRFLLLFCIQITSIVIGSVKVTDCSVESKFHSKLLFHLLSMQIEVFYINQDYSERGAVMQNMIVYEVV